MLALIAALCFLLAFFDVSFAGHSLAYLGGFFLSLHFFYPVSVPVRSNRAP